MWLLLWAVAQQQAQGRQVSLGSSVVKRKGPGVCGGPGVDLAALQQPISDLVVAEARGEVQDGGSGRVSVLSEGRRKTAEDEVPKLPVHTWSNKCLVTSEWFSIFLTFHKTEQQFTNYQRLVVASEWLIV